MGKLWKVISLMAIVVLLGGAVYLSCSSDKSSSSGISTEWTILMYSDGNNNLDNSQGGASYCIQDIQDLQTVGSSDKVQIVAMVSSMRTGGIAKYYHIEHYPDDLGDAISSTVLVNKGTKDMSDWHTLQEFLEFGIDNYPAKKYMLIVDDHGAGWPGSCADDQNGSGNIMSMYDMANAIEQTIASKGIGKFEIVTFHACLMSMVEVAYELRNSSNYLVASEFSMPMESVLGANIWLTNLVAHPTTGPGELATSIVDAVYQTGVNKQKIVHMAATDLSQIGRLAARIDNFGTQLTTSAGDYWLEVLDAWVHTNTSEYDNPAYVDIRELANKIKQEPNLQNINLIRNAADSIINAMNDAVVMTSTNAQGITRGGLTIHMPYQRVYYDSTNYDRIDFRAVPWTNFISRFIGVIEDLQQNVTINGSITWTGQSLSYPILALINNTGDILKFWHLNGGAETAPFSVTFTTDEAAQAYIYAFDDLNNNGTVQEAGEPWNCYDSDGDMYCEYYTFEGGQVLNDINIIIYAGADKQGLAPAVSSTK